MTIDRTILRAVRSMRREQPDLPITRAVTIARYLASEPTTYEFLKNWEQFTDEPVTGQIGDILITVKLADDDDAQLGEDDVTGSFTDKREPGCIRNTTTGRNGRDCEWYRPANVRSGDSWKWYHQRGMSKAAAREHVAALIKDDMAEDANRSYVGVTVTAGVAGHTIDHDGLWGIDVGDDRALSRAYLIETVDDLIRTILDNIETSLDAAIATARTSVDQLVAARNNLRNNPRSAE